MKKTTTKFTFLSFILFFVVQSYSQTSVWNKVTSNKASLNTNSGSETSFILNKKAFKNNLLNTSKHSKNVRISFPTGINTFTEFNIIKTQVMHPLLAKKFPKIETFEGIATDNSNQKIRFSYCSKFGLNGIVSKSDNTKLEITPINASLHSFKLQDKESSSNNTYECTTKENLTNFFSLKNLTNRNVDDGFLRRYRLALSCTGEYAQHFLDGSEANDNERVIKVLTAMVTSINRLNEIFETDFGITLQLIPENDQLIYLNANTDPYYNGSTLNTELQTTLDGALGIGADSYDVGHLYGKEPRIYGNAGCIACVCTDGEKGSGFTIHSDPSSDNMNLIATHEFGHQFGAYHTQSSASCRSGFNSEVEPGSGSTIMSYAGICFPDVQQEPDDYFNYTSIRDIAIWTINNSNCAELIPTSNNAPVIDFLSDYTIPIATPFVLEANVTDSDSSTLTYCWEQNDTGLPYNSTETPTSDRVQGPLFRSLPPSPSQKRYFPALPTVVSGNLASTWEVLPTVGRTMNFSLTVRDNAANGGQTVTDLMQVTVNDNVGPFSVSSQSSKNEIWTVGEQVTVTWQVANTNTAPINTENVQILLSTNSGVSFDFELLASTPNNGSASFTIPDVDATTEARVMIKAINNIYYAVNSADFTIEKSEYVISVENSKLETCNTDTAIFNLNYQTFLGFSEEVTLQLENLPSGITAELSRSNFSDDISQGEEFTLTVSDINTLSNGLYPFEIIGISENNVEKRLNLNLEIFSVITEAATLLFPENNSTAIDPFLTFEWMADINTTSYTVEIASNAEFSSLLQTTDVIDNKFTSNNFENNQSYFWRVRNNNTCSSSEYSEVHTFSTKCKSAENISIFRVGLTYTELNWEGTNDSWKIEYGVSGFSIGSGTILTTNNNSIRIENLEPGVNYDLYIQGKCVIGNSSTISDVINFTTAFDFCGEQLFYDSGGELETYLNNENTTTVIAPNNPNDRVRVTFNEFNTEANYDFLNVYDGPNTSAPSLGSFSGLRTNLEFISTHESGTLTFVFTSDIVETRSGWEAVVTCETKPNCDAPTNFVFQNISAKEASFIWNQPSQDKSWTLEYEVEGFEIGTGKEIISNETNVLVTDLIPNTKYEIYLKANCSIGGNSDTIGSLKFTTLEACPAPTNFEITNITDSTASLVWETTNAAQAWEIEYGTPGFILGNGTTLQVTENNATIENLNSDTEYDIYVRANCDTDGYGAWTAPLTFKTPINFCNGDRFFDSGGEFGNYFNNEIEITVIAPESDEGRVRVNFNNYNFENCCDRLLVYDGPSTNFPLLGRISDTFNANIVSSHESGSLTFVFTSDGSVTGNGWDATVICEAKPNCASASDFDIDTILARGVELSWSQSTDDTNWTLEYGSPGFTIGTGTEISTANSTATISNLTPETEYDIYLKTNCTIGGFSDSLGPLTFTTLIACPVPVNFDILSITNNTATLTWNTNTEAVSWVVEYGLTGFLIGEGTVIEATENEITIENLDGNTTYDIYVKANCDTEGFSKLTNPLVFKTECDQFVAPFLESFTSNSIPDCWLESDIFNTWQFNTFADNDAAGVQDRNPQGNSNYAWLDGSNFSSTDTFNLETPLIDASGLINPSLSFSVFSKNTIDDTYNTLSVSVHDISGTSYQNLVVVNENTNIWKDFVVDLSEVDTSMPFYVEFSVSLDSPGQPFLNDILIDEIKVDELPSCTNPQNLTITNIKGRSAQLNWISTDNETNWEILYGERGFNTSNSFTKFTTTNPVILTDLLPETSYEVYLRALCGIGDNSEFIGPVSFVTGCDALPVPFFEDFTNEFNIPNCWLADNNPLTWKVGTYFDINNNQIIPDRSNPSNPRYLFKENNTDTMATKYLYSPYFNITDLTTPSLSFSINSRSNSDTANTRLIVDFFDGSSWNTIANIEELTIGWKDIYLNLSSFTITGEIRFRFNIIHLTANNNAGNLLIDNISLNELPSCFNPSQLIASDINTESATISWQTGHAESEWEIQYGEIGFEVETGTTLAVQTTPEIQLTNLNSNTAYDVYVRANCELSDGYSDWIGPVSIQTLANFCNGDHFYDTGGAFGTYDNNENTTTIIAPANDGDRVRVRFNSLSLESCCDRLTVYDGPDTSFPLLNNFGSTPGEDIIASHESGTLTFVFTSDGSVTEAGWDAVVFCEPIPNCSAPIDFTNKLVSAKEAEFSWNAIGSDSNWTLEYGQSGFELGNGIEVTTNNTTVTITNLLPDTNYDIYIKTSCDLGGFSDLVGALNFTTLIACPSPTNFTNRVVSDSSATVIWDNLFSNEWEIEYGELGFIQGTGTVIQASENSIQIENLESNTIYQAYVRANCGDDGFSAWSQLLSFTTNPDFCNGDHFYDTGGEFGNYSNSENTITTISPSKVGDRVRVHFNSFETESCCDRLFVYDGPDTSFPFLGDYSSMPTQDFIASHASGTLTFEFISDGSVTESGWDATVICEPIATCPTPQNFEATQITLESAKLNWDNASVSSWEIEYGEAPLTQGAGTTIITNLNSLELVNLNPFTTYDVFIFSICDFGISETNSISFISDDSTLSTNNNELTENSIVLFPNPNNGIFTIANTSKPN
ncbi:fibronectin type III domain-containing protein [Aquimarina agarivorans]|uniref:fibronectin type III domain-containing protein n=1 Tax=Aquimarina agarivorans TaxID=980584 RepID=UPI000248EA76|nr:fibronectin type III domain-containing protein [Aquimarina agarivorans]